MKKITPFRRFLSLIALLPFGMGISCTATGITQQAVNNQASETQWLTGIDNCEKTVELYFDWHAKAISVGSSLEVEEYNWLHEFGFRQSGPFYEMYDEAIAQQQNIKQFKSIAVACIVPNELADSIGKIDVTYYSKTDETITHYFVDQPYDAFNVEHKQNPFVIAADEEPVPQRYLDQLPNKIAGYENEIKRAKGLLSDFAVFNEEEVELLIYFPNDIIATTIQEKTSNSIGTNNGERKNTRTVSEHLYERAGDTMRVTALPQNDERNKLPKDAQLFLTSDKHIESCESLARMCTSFIYRLVPVPYVFEPPKYYRSEIVDNGYIKAVNTWMDNQLPKSEKSRKLQGLVTKELDRIVSENELVYEINNRDTLFIEHLNALRLKRGEYTPIGWRLFTTWTQKTFKYAGKHEKRNGVTYLGKAPCKADDTENNCARIEFVREVMNPGEGASDIIHYLLTLNMIVEPHTLLVHSYTADEKRSEKRKDQENAPERLIENTITSSSTYRAIN